jgi:hypothetical protein
MPTADLRIFRCTSGYDAAGKHVLQDAVLDERRVMPIWLPGLLEVNALAAPLNRALTYQLKQHELNIVLSFLKASPAGKVAARLDDLKAAARHIRSFVIESVGMGMLTATMRDFYRWNGNHTHLEHFDALPIRISSNYLRGGVRPDLLFLDPAIPTSAMAGEARGRSTKPPTSLTPLKAQWQRLDEILSWSARHRYHPVTMAWTCLGGPSVGVDFFHIEFPPPPRRRPAPQSVPVRPPPQTPRENSDPAESSSSSITDYFGRRQVREGSSVSGPEEEVRGLRANVTTAIEHLYQTAPLEDRTQIFNGAPVRGSWVPANLLGATRTQLFLGVLSEEPPADFQMALRERRRANSDAAFDPIQVELLGRLIVAVSLDSDFAPPWQAVAARLE